MPDFTSLGTAVTENFDSLSNTAGSTTNSTLPSGWAISETGGGARDNEQYGVDTGGSNTGDTFSYGSAGSTERALGSLRSGTLIPTFGVSFTNKTGSTISSLDVGFTGEEWRLGTAARTDQLSFEYSLDATSLITGTWTGVSALNFVTPNTATTGAKDGNASGNFTALAATISSLSITNGGTVWFRWVDTDATGADDGLAIDNFSVTAKGVSAVPDLTINNVSQSETNAGTTTFAFTVSLSAPAPAGGVTFDISTANGSATTADSDYVANTLTSQTIPAGSSTYTFNVTVNGDTAVESDESFFVNITNVAGAAVVDGQGLGTITNDDAPPTPNLTIDNVALSEANVGTTTFAFTVTLSSPAPAGGVTFDIATADGAATSVSGDFVAQTLTSQTIPAGSSSYTFNVAVNGDTVVEPNENFFVNVTNVTGAVVTDGQGQGTINNDDLAPPGHVFINEIHYDNAGTDSGEFIEVAGKAGTDLTGYKLVLYNGSNTPLAAPTYLPLTTLSGTIDDEGQGYGAVSFSYAANGIQNGNADGVALIAPDGTVMQLLSYEGVFTAATATPAAGKTSTDIGVSEDGSGPIGNSLQLIGNGASYADFTWQGSALGSPGLLNTLQTIIPDSGTGLISVGDVSVNEGNAGTTNMVFTVLRAGGLGSAASVDYTVSLSGTANAADLAVGALLTGTASFAIGAPSATITVAVQGDVTGEPNETLALALSNPVGTITITDAAATGTILNDDPLSLTIMQIQGAGHASANVGQPVITAGIVTAVAGNGFYMQDPAGDANAATSDAIFVFTSSAPTVSKGDSLSVTGTIAEFAASATSLTTTQITSPVVTVFSSGNPLPVAKLIGASGTLPPSAIIDDDSFATFDPASDGIDFWESLEGMLVTLETPQAVSNSNSFGETDVVVSFGAGATYMNDRGGITISAGDFNPEKIQIDDSLVSLPVLSIGDQLASVTGVVNYAFNVFEVIATSPVTVTSDVTLTEETTALQGDASHLTLATYNLENIDTGDNKFNLFATDIVFNLRAPDIIAVQEIQDADGAGGGSNLSGTVTATGLINAIIAAGGPTYTYIEIAPTTANSTGGEPNGNIRNGYFYNAARVSYIAGSATLLTDAAFDGSRKPLAATFSFGGEQFTAINVHFTSRGGSAPLWGDVQPPANGGEAARIAQAAAVLNYVNAQLAGDPAKHFAVMGDFNGFDFEPFQTQLTTAVFTNLNTLLPVGERYSYLFEGNAQQLDHILVTGGLFDGGPGYDAVHLNSQFDASPTRPTDHDPQLARLYLNAAPVAGDDTVSAVEDIVITYAAATLLGNDTDATMDTLVISSVSGASGGAVVLNGDGSVTYTPASNFNGTAGFDYVVSDGKGGTDTGHVTINVAAVQDVPIAFPNQLVTIDEDTSVSLAIGAIDVDGDTLSYTLSGPPVSGSASVGGGIASYTPAANFTGVESFSVAISDGKGGVTTQVITVIVQPQPDAPVITSNGGGASAAITVSEGVTGVTKVTAVDPDVPTVLAYSISGGADAALFAIDAASGALNFKAATDFEAPSDAGANNVYDVIVRASDGALFDEQALAITVSNLSEAPQLTGTTATLPSGLEDTAYALSLADLVKGYSDPGGKALSVTGLTLSAGSAKDNGSGFTVTTPLDFNGPVTLNYLVTTSGGLTTAASQTVQFSPVNDAPVFTSKSETMELFQNKVGGLQVAATDVDGDAITFAATGAAHGAISGGLNGLFSYTPAAGYAGADSFVVTASDGKGGATSQTVQVIVKASAPVAVNTAPVVQPAEQKVSTFVGASRAVTVAASDADGDALNFAASAASHGTVSGGKDGAFVYTPTAGYIGSDAFAVTVSDGKGASVLQTVSLSVTAAPDLVPEWLLVAPTGTKGSVGGTGTVFGTSGFQWVTVLDKPATTVFDASFNGGGDVIRLAGAASQWQIARSASSAILTDGDTNVVVPVGVDGAMIAFDDGIRFLRFDTATSSFTIGTQSFDSALTTVTAAADPTAVPPAPDLNASGVVIFTDAGSITLSGNYTVFGTKQAQVVEVLGGKVTLDPSFNTGGDLLDLAAAPQTFSARLVGSSVELSGGGFDVKVPVGLTGMPIEFDGGQRTLLYDPATANVLLGTQIISATPSNLAPFA